MYLASKGHSMQIKLAIICYLLFYVALIFVDDCGFLTMATSTTETIAAVVRRHQYIGICWAGGLRVTEGAL